MANIRASVTVDPSSGPMIRLNVWAENDSGQVSVGLANCIVNLYTQAGVLLSGPHNAASPDAQGVFAVSFVDPGIVVGQTAVYFRMSAEVASVQTFGIVGCTFARTS